MTTLTEIYLKIIELRDSGMTYKQIQYTLHVAKPKIIYAIKNRKKILNVKQNKNTREIEMNYKLDNVNTDFFYKKHEADVIRDGIPWGISRSGIIGVFEGKQAIFSHPTEKKYEKEWKTVKSITMKLIHRITLSEWQKLTK